MFIAGNRKKLFAFASLRVLALLGGVLLGGVFSKNARAQSALRLSNRRRTL